MRRLDSSIRRLNHQVAIAIGGTMIETANPSWGSTSIIAVKIPTSIVVPHPRSSRNHGRRPVTLVTSLVTRATSQPVERTSK